jgi:hypothetical protein
MARSRYDWTQAKFERYVKEERGKGRGERLQALDNHSRFSI